MKTIRFKAVPSAGDAEQQRWLEQDLRRNQDKQLIFVYRHHPVLYGRFENLNLIRLFEQYSVSAVFSGHSHLYGHHERNGVHYFVAGGCSDETFTKLEPRQPSSFVFDRYGPHYLLLEVDQTGAKTSGISPDNKIFESTLIKPRKVVNR